MMLRRLLKRDGSVAFGFLNPDGSWVEMPAPDGDSQAPSVRMPEEPRQLTTQRASPALLPTFASFCATSAAVTAASR
jgi:hypothetical protein